MIDMVPDKFARFRAIAPLLRLLTIIFAAIAIIVVGVTLPMAETPDFYSDGLGPAMALFVMPIAAYSIVWCITAMLVLFLNGPYHPAIDIGFDILGWAGSWACGILTIETAAYLSDVSFYCTYDDYYHEYDYEDECRLAKKYDALLYASAAFLLISGTLHLALLILSCRATHVRRMKKRDSFVELDDVAHLKDGTTAA